VVSNWLLNNFVKERFMTLLLFFITVLAIPSATLRIIFALKAGNRPIASRTLSIISIWLSLYFILLLAFSLTSNERVLGLNRKKHFAGCYFDQHLSASVQEVISAKSIGNSSSPLNADGSFYIVTIKIETDAKRASFTILIVTM
jgi:hypothetical protein